MQDVQQVSSRRIALVVDPLSLRRAGVMAVLGAWAEANGVVLLDTSADDLGELASKPVGMTIVNLGGRRLREPGARALIGDIKSLLGDVRIAVIADSEDADDVSEGFACGIHGYIPTSTKPEIALPALSFILSGGSYFPPSILFSAARRNLKMKPGHPRRDASGVQSCSWLSPAQSRIIELLCSGRSNKAIARDLSICEATVKAHLRAIMRRLSLASRTQVAIYFASRAAIDESGEGVAPAAIAGEVVYDAPEAADWPADVPGLAGAGVATPAPSASLSRRASGPLHRPT